MGVLEQIEPSRRDLPTMPVLKPTMKRFFSTLFSFLAILSGQSLAGEKPNVILVITDDQGYGDLSCHGNPVLRSPALDRLHAESVRLTNFHVSPTCSPTRAALMSGHWPNRAGVWLTFQGRSLLRPESPTLAELFAAAGYDTGHFGKWHLGDNHPFRPEDRGFGEVLRHGGGGVGQIPDHWDNAYFEGTYLQNGKPRRFDGYCTDVFFEEARRFIATSTEAGRPFFAYISTNAPHGPFHVADRYRAPYRDRGLTKKEEVFFGMIANLDENVGILRVWLKERGLAENTLFVFLSDNGTADGERVFNAGMRGKKGTPYEGGHRVPLFLHWPRGGLSGGRDVSTLAAHVDVLPTLADLCGLPLPSGYAPDGRSLLPAIYRLPTAWPDRVITTDSQRKSVPEKWKNTCTMSGDWRLINGSELYDIATDPKQERDLAAQHPQVVERLRAAYEKWWAELEPGFAEHQRIVIGSPKENPADLTSMDWITDDGVFPYPPWNQSLTREGVEARGRWALRAARVGRYRIELRRWPRETGTAITAALPAGAPSPGLVAYRETPGKALPVTRARVSTGSWKEEKPVPPDATHIAFEAKLPVGPIELQAEFLADDGRIWGVYYVRITCLDVE